jgi:O-antigen ligase
MIINEYNNYQISGIKSTTKRFILLIFFVLIGFFISNDNLTGQFNENISRGDTQITDDPRVEIFTNSLIIWSKSDLSTKLFGSGLMSSMEIAGRSTHNSYLTILLEFGLIYLIYFLIFNLYILQRCWYMSKSNSLFSLIFCIISFILIRSLTNNTIGGTSIAQLMFNFCLIMILKYDIIKNNLKH